MNSGYITAGELVDGTHPGNAGYLKMAAIWSAAFKKVFTKGWIKNAIDTGHPDDGDATCMPSPDGFRGPVKTQQGSGFDDGTYVHSSTFEGNIAGTVFNSKTTTGIVQQFHFAQLVNINGVDRGQEVDELIQVLDLDQRDPSHGSYYMSYMVNVGGKYSLPWIPFDVGMQCLNRGVRWGDVNNDGLSDFICVGPDGSLQVSINRGGNPPTFEFIGQIRAGTAAQDHVILGDIDGDGRLDYCEFGQDGDSKCSQTSRSKPWRHADCDFATSLLLSQRRFGRCPHRQVWWVLAGNGEFPPRPGNSYRTNVDQVGGLPTFDHKSMPGIQGVRLVDINGDGRDDWGT